LLYKVFRACRAGEFRQLGLDDATLESLLQMQHAAQLRQYASAYPQAECRIIEVDGVPVGSLTCDEGEALRLIDIAILPEWQNQGIGSSVIRQLMASGKAIDLNVASTNRARHLYERLGFTKVASDDMYIQMRRQKSDSQ
jgi:ribosomal protein S18 acetylase RimI-like enzyme